MTKHPIGVSIALVFCNFPVAVIIPKVVAALAAGYSLIVYPNPGIPLSVLMLAELAMQAGVSNAVLNVTLEVSGFVHAVGLQTHPIMLCRYCP
jgi:acyl-CoA reductase-like NAD-dependent aldehyde dehydrogenase